MHSNNKKSQGMPVNVIIIATLSLIVLVVLVAIFSGRARIFSQSLESCAVKQGGCKPSPCPDGYASVSNTECEKDKANPICCVKVFDTQEAKPTKDDLTKNIIT